MKLLFRGWSREVNKHDHSVIPVTRANNRYAPGKTDDPLTWASPLQALGKIDDLSLGGSFLVEFNFEQEELRNWLSQFVMSEPEAAVKLLAEMQGEAVLALMRKAEEHMSQKDS